MQWALGYATNKGLAIREAGGETITIPSVRVGNMLQPDADAFVALFLDRLQQGDVVLSPSGPNYTYLPGAYARSGTVYWIHPGLLKGVTNVATHLHQRFRDAPSDFYSYEPQDTRIAALGLLTRSWINLERQRAGDENGYSQLLRRERDFFRFFQPDRAGWIARVAATEERKLAKRLRDRDVELTKEQREKLKQKLVAQATQLYESYFRTPETKEEKLAHLKAREELTRQRLEWFGIEEMEDFYASEVRRALTDTPENALFDGLIGDGAVKTRAEILTFMRNPLFYPTAGHLRSYAGIGINDGHAIERRRGETHRGSPEFRRALCFDFAEKYWQNDPVGFFQPLYYAYKAHQYHVYWDLIELTSDVFTALARKTDDEDAADDAEAVETAPGDVDVRPFVARLTQLTELDLIAKSKPIRQAITDLEREPTREGLWRIFARSPKFHGLNLQMTGKRIERQVKRKLGATLLDTVYYRWLAQLDRPLPLAEDGPYLRAWRTVEGRTDGVPDTYDHEVVLQYYRLRVAELQRERTLPDDVLLKFMPPDVRKNEIARRKVDTDAQDALSSTAA